VRAERYRLRERPVPPRGAWSARYSWGTFRGMRLNRNVENTTKAPHFAGNVVPSRAIASHELRSGLPIRPSPDFGFVRRRLPSLSTVDVRCGPKSRTNKWNYNKTLSIRP